jgi:DNA-binding transcriptional LysR family regulator
MQRYPKMRVETVSEARMIDIVAEGYDAGIRLAESVPQDMVAVALTPDIRQLIVATPDHFARYGIPQTPDDLLHHQDWHEDVPRRAVSLGAGAPW